MVKSKLRYYTYKITFKDLPKYFYYGYHRDTGSPYFGTPKTWKHLWEQFEPEIQILQWFETEDEAQELERKLIKSTWESKYSLNENCGGKFSQSSRVTGGRKGGKGASKEQKIENGRRGGFATLLSKSGIHSEEYKRSEKYTEDHVRSGRSGRGEKKAKGGRIGGKIGGKTTSKQKWMCTITNHISTPGGLSSYQKSRGIDTSNRVRIQ